MLFINDHIRIRQRYHHIASMVVPPRTDALRSEVTDLEIGRERCQLLRIVLAFAGMQI